MQGKRPAAGGVVGDSQYVTFGPFRFDRHGLVLSTGGRPVPVQPKALGVLRCLVDRAGEVVLKQDLMDAVWEDAAVTDNSLTEAVRLLRKALDDDPRSPTYIETMHRRGYRFIAPIASSDAAVAIAVGIVSREARRTGTAARQRRLIWGLGVAAVFLAFAISSTFPPRSAPDLEAAADSDPLPEGALIVRPPINGVFLARYVDLVLTSDGSSLLYTTALGSLPQVYVRDREGGPPRPFPLPRETGLWKPFAAPDGEHIGFFSLGGALNVVSVADGTHETLCKPCNESIGEASYSGGTWALDGTIVYAHGRLMKLSAHGGSSQTPEPIPSGVIDRLGGQYLWPHFLPGDEWVLATHRTGDKIQGSDVYLVNVHNGEERVILKEASKATYVDGGHVVFMRGNDLWGVAFDLDGPTPVGEAMPVVEGIATSDWVGKAQYTVSPNGELAYLPGPLYAERTGTLLSADRAGETTPLLEAAEEFEYHRLSPSADRLAVSVYNGPDRDIRIYRLDRENAFVDIPRPISNESRPVWHPDGDRIAFSSEEPGAPLKVVQESVEGEILFDAELVSRDARWLFPTSWSPDGETLAYTVAESDGSGSDVWTVDVVSREHRAFAATELDEQQAVFSPDGRWLAYIRGDQIVVAPYPEGASAEPVAPWSQRVLWGRRGDELGELLYVNRGLWTVPIRTVNGELDAGEPTRLPVETYRGGDFDVVPGGERFILANRSLRSPQSSEIVVISDLSALVQRALPSR